MVFVVSCKVQKFVVEKIHLVNTCHSGAFAVYQYTVVGVDEYNLQLLNSGASF